MPNDSEIIYAKLRATELAPGGNSNLSVAFFVGEQPGVLQNSGVLYLRYREYEEFAVGFLVTAFLSKGKLSVELDGWNAEQLTLKFSNWLDTALPDQPGLV